MDECQGYFQWDTNHCHNSVSCDTNRRNQGILTVNQDPTCNMTASNRSNNIATMAVLICDNGITSLASSTFDLFYSGTRNAILSLRASTIVATPGGTITLWCSGSAGHVMMGMRWTILSHNYTKLIYLGGGEDYLNYSSGNYESKKEISFESRKYWNIDAVFCSAPLWDSYDWIRTSLTISSQVPEKPRLVTPNGTFACPNTTETPLIFTCEASGYPIPKYRWEVIVWDSKYWIGRTLPPHNLTGLQRFNLSERSSIHNISTNGNVSTLTVFWKEWSTMYSKAWNFYEISLRKQHKIGICTAYNPLGNDSSYVFMSSCEKTQPKGSDKYIAIGLGVGLSISIFLIIGGLWLGCKTIRKHKNALRDLTYEEIKEFQFGNPEMLCAYDESYEIPRDKFSIEDTILGSGEFGLVNKGKYGNHVVAVKSMKKTTNVVVFKAFLTELKVMTVVGHHVNIVNLLGACTRNIRKREVFILTEYCAKGNLLKLLRNSRPVFVDYFNQNRRSRLQSVIVYQNASIKKLSTKDLLRWASDVANGMEFLSQQNVVHGDLAARNILVTECMTAKVSDFGLAKQLYEYSVYVQKTHCPLPLRWMAIESLQDLEFSIQSDIWSYGVTIWEIFSLSETPYATVQWGFDSWQLLRDGMRLPQPSCGNISIYKILLDCWHENPNKRPNFASLSEFFYLELYKLN